MTDLHQKMFVTMSSLLFLVIVLAWIERAGAHEQNQEWTLTLQPDGQPPAPYGLTGQQGTVRIAVEDDGSALNFALSGLRPRSVHGVWLLLKTATDPNKDCGAANQQSCEPPFRSCVGVVCQVLDPATGQNTAVYSFTPAAADTSGFTAGNGLDPNGFVTNARGDAKVQIRLNYNVFGDAVSPVRASVAGVDVVDHFDGLTHGHVPGMNVANPAFASCGDFAGRLSGSLEDAVPSRDK